MKFYFSCLGKLLLACETFCSLCLSRGGLSYFGSGCTELLLVWTGAESWKIWHHPPHPTNCWTVHWLFWRRWKTKSSYSLFLWQEVLQRKAPVWISFWIYALLSQSNNFSDVDSEQCEAGGDVAQSWIHADPRPRPKPWRGPCLFCVDSDVSAVQAWPALRC